MSTKHEDERIALYALGGISADERAQVEAHLRTCAPCRERLREARAVINLLPRSVEPMKPSPDTKRKLMARVDADLAKNRERVAIAPSLWSRLFSPQFAYGAAALFVAFLAAYWFVSQGSTQNQVAQILSNPNAQTRTINGTKEMPGAQGRLVAIPGENRAALVVNGLTPLPENQTYEFWLIKDKPIPAGLFRVDANGSATFLVNSPENISAIDKLGVTIEQAAGEPAPKGPMVMAAGL